MAYQQPSPLNEGQNQDKLYPQNHSPSIESPPSFHEWEMPEAISIQHSPMIEFYQDQDSPPEPLSLTDSAASIHHQLHSRLATLAISNGLPSNFCLVPKRLIATQIQVASQYPPPASPPATPPPLHSAKLHHRARTAPDRLATMKRIGSIGQRRGELARISMRYHAKAEARFQKMRRELEKDMAMEMGAKRVRGFRIGKAVHWVPVEASGSFGPRG
jgi:hypothetical protein